MSEIEKVSVRHGDCLEVLATLPENSVDSVVTDPPYHFTSIVKRFGKEDSAPAQYGTDGAFARASRGFMGKEWDGGDIAFRPETWAAVMRVLKPGGHMVAFGAPKNYHRLACAIEDAGFEIRDSLMWVTGQGFPKSLNVSKALENECCDCKRPEGATSDLQHDMRSVSDADISPGVADGAQSAHILFKGVSEHGSSERGTVRSKPEIARGEQPSLEGRRDAETTARELQGRDVCESAGLGEADGARGRLHNAASSGDGADVRVSSDPAGSGQPQGSQSSKQRSKQSRIVADERGSQAWGGWPVCDRCGKPRVIEGLGTALKPAYEPVVLARKPLSESTVAANVLRWGTGAINVDACRVKTSETITNHARGSASAVSKGIYGDSKAQVTYQTDGQILGRYPANLAHDGSDEVLEGFPQNCGANGGKGKFKQHTWLAEETEQNIERDKGSAARFFYCAKANKHDRAGSKHPTVKPVALMQWLVRMVTPPGGTVLDPFAGSGTTGQAAINESFPAILIEREQEYHDDIIRRLTAASSLKNLLPTL